MRQECNGRNSLRQDKEKEEYHRMKRAEEAVATTLHERPEREILSATPQRSCAPTANSAMAAPRAYAAKLKRHEGVLFNKFHPKVSSTWTVNCLEPKVYLLRKPSETYTETRPLGWGFIQKCHPGET
jgi:hypothetical protein